MKLTLLCEETLAVGNYSVEIGISNKTIYAQAPDKDPADEVFDWDDPRAKRERGIHNKIPVSHSKAFIKLTHKKTDDWMEFTITGKKNHYVNSSTFGKYAADRIKKPWSKFEVIEQLDRMLGVGVGKKIYDYAVSQL